MRRILMASSVIGALAIAASAQAHVVLAPVNPVLVDTTYASTSGVQTAQIDFVNHLTQTVDIYWINYSGDRVFYNALAGDSSYIQDTFITHPWLVALAGSGDTTAQGSGTLITAFASAVTPAAFGSSVYDIANIGVPEPAAWATVLAGMALVGGAMRRRTSRAVAA